jgi:hypothetical protein
MSVRIQPMTKLLFVIGCFFASVSAANTDNYLRLILPDTVDSQIELQFDGSAHPDLKNAALQVFVGKSTSCCNGRSPIAGKHSRTVNRITFRPAFRFESGQAYTVLAPRIDQQGKAVESKHEFTLKGEFNLANPHVVNVYPSGPNLPENTLRFYVHFSAPMQPHRSTEHIKLVDAQGNVDNNAFMSFKQELWSEDRKRLTVLMDPGRIKRGVAQNLTLGPALEQGHRYTIIVDEGWPGANGQSVAAKFEKGFVTTAALRTRPDLSYWSVSAPKIQSIEPLVINLDRPFDHASLSNSILILTDKGAVVSGSISIENYEQRWKFAPKEPWEGKQLTILVDAHLEDVAGNNFKDLLDHSIGTESIQADQLSLSVNLQDH